MSRRDLRAVYEKRLADAKRYTQLMKDVATRAENNEYSKVTIEKDKLTILDKDSQEVSDSYIQGKYEDIKQRIVNVTWTSESGWDREIYLIVTI